MNSATDLMKESEIWGYLKLLDASAVVTSTPLCFSTSHGASTTVGSAQTCHQVVSCREKSRRTEVYAHFTWNRRTRRGCEVLIQRVSKDVNVLVNDVVIAFGKTMPILHGDKISFNTQHYQFASVISKALTDMQSKYKSVDVLGEGSFGKVWKVMDRTTEQLYAIKVLKHADISGGHQTGFRTEINILERLAHSGICRLKESFMGPGMCAMVLEYVGGGDLGKYIDAHAHGVPEHSAHAITLQICEAMAYVHAQGIVHRDLKPENVLITTDKPVRIKIADFGLAKVTSPGALLQSMVGTPNFMAPEVLDQAPRLGYDPLVDVYSVGIMVCQMVTSAFPWDHPKAVSSSFDVTQWVKTRVIDFKLLNQATVSACGRLWIMDMLSRDPKRRPTFAGALTHPWLITKADTALNLSGLQPGFSHPLMAALPAIKTEVSLRTNTAAVAILKTKAAARANAAAVLASKPRRRIMTRATRAAAAACLENVTLATAATHGRL